MGLIEVAVLAADNNPFEGVSPSWGSFASVRGIATAALGVVWAAAFVYVAYRLIVAGAKLAAARRAGYGNHAEDALGEMKWAGGSAVVLTALPVLFTAVVGLGQ